MRKLILLLVLVPFAANAQVYSTYSNGIYQVDYPMSWTTAEQGAKFKAETEGVRFAVSASALGEEVGSYEFQRWALDNAQAMLDATRFDIVVLDKERVQVNYKPGAFVGGRIEHSNIHVLFYVAAEGRMMHTMMWFLTRRPDMDVIDRVVGSWEF